MDRYFYINLLVEQTDKHIFKCKNYIADMKVCLLTIHELARLLKEGTIGVKINGEKVILMVKPREIIENVKFKKGGRKMNTIAIPKEWRDNDLIVVKIPEVRDHETR